MASFSSTHLKIISSVLLSVKYDPCYAIHPQQYNTRLRYVLIGCLITRFKNNAICPMNENQHHSQSLLAADHCSVDSTLGANEELNGWVKG